MKVIFYSTRVFDPGGATMEKELKNLIIIKKYQAMIINPVDIQASLDD